MPFYDFKCPADHVFEDMVPVAQTTLPCPTCGAAARRLVSLPMIDPRLGLDPAFRTVGDRWAKIREQRKRIEEARARDHGPDTPRQATAAFSPPA